MGFVGCGNQFYLIESGVTEVGVRYEEFRPLQQRL